MAGIIFLKTKDRKKIVRFYQEKVGMEIWLEQADCTILRHGNMLIGFCQQDSIDQSGIITFFYQTRAEVDQMFDKFKEQADDKPRDNPKYRIYHFFAQDPEGRSIEFQYFLDPVKSF